MANQSIHLVARLVALPDKVEELKTESFIVGID
jgi:hypothetical protein